MEKTLKFRTNIKCSGCVAKVTPYLNDSEDISHWDVDTESIEKTLTVTTDKLSKEEVEAIVKEAGFKADAV